MKLAMLLMVGCICAHAQTYYATTIAGANHDLNGVPATSSPFSAPEGLAFDSTGDLYVADWQANLVRKITPNGLVYTVAGDGNSSPYLPFVGPATTTQLPEPVSVATDSNQNVYIAEEFPGVVVRVSPNGQTEVYGGIALCSGSTCTPAPNGGPATQQFLDPQSLATDSLGNLYIAGGDATIRKVTSQGNMIIVAGTGMEGFSGDNGPALQATFGQGLGLASDPAGNLYVADAANGRVREISTNGIVTTIAGTGSYFLSPVPDNTPALAANINPTGLAYSAGLLYIVNASDVSDILRLDLSTGNITNIPYDPGPVSPYVQIISINGPGVPTAVAVDASGALYVSDSRFRRVRKIQDGQATTYAGLNSVGDNGPANDAFLFNPWGVAFSGSSIFVADFGNGYVRRIGPDLHIYGLSRTPSPSSLTANGRGDIFFGTENAYIWKLPGGTDTPSIIAGQSDDGYSGDGGPATNATVDVEGLATDTTGNLFIAADSRIRVINASSGIITTIAGTGQDGYSGVAGPALDTEIESVDVAVDQYSNIYSADPGGRIQKITPDGIITTIAGAGELSFASFGGDGGPAILADLGAPQGIAVDNGGNVYIADTDNYRVRKITTDGIIQTIAGTGAAAPWTNDGPALQSNLTPQRLTVDSFGNVYVTDIFNGRLIRLSPVIPGSTLNLISGNGQSGTIGSPLPNPLIVQVTGANGAGIAGVPITFTSNGAILAPASILTGKDGTASSVATVLSPHPNIAVTATAPGLPPIVFSVTGYPVHRAFH